jgi:hypothetical protein
LQRNQGQRHAGVAIAMVALFFGTSMMPLVAAEPELREPTEAEITAFVGAWVLRLASPIDLEAWWAALAPDPAGDEISPEGKFLMAQRLRQNLTTLDPLLHGDVYPAARPAVWQANERFLDYVLNATAFDPAGFKAAFAPANLSTPTVSPAGPSPLDDVQDVLDQLGLPTPPLPIPGILDPDLDALGPLLNPPVPVPDLPWDGLVPFAPQVELPVEPGALLPPLPLPPLPPVPRDGAADGSPVDGAADGQPSSSGAAAAAQYKACGRMVGFDTVCGEWVAVGTPVPLNLDDEAGSEVGVLLTPVTARPLTDAVAAAGTPDAGDRLAFLDPAVAAASQLPGAAEDLAGQAGGAGVMLLIQPLPATPCDVSVALDPLATHLACSTVIQGVPDLEQVEDLTDQQAVPALVWIKYPVVTLPDGSLESLRSGSEPGAIAKLVELGVDGTADRLPNATQVDFRIKSIAELAQGNLTADLNFSFQDPPASIALVASVKNSTEGGAPEDPTNVTIAFTPVPNLNLTLDMALNGSRVNATLNASLSPLVDLTVHSERADPYLRRNVQAVIDTLPERVTVTYERLSDGNLIVYDSSAPIHRTTVQFDEDAAESTMAGNVTVHELPSRILVELHTDDEAQGNAHYEAASVIPQVEADFSMLNKTDTNRTAGTADVHNIPARFDVTWDTTSTPDVFTFDASSSLGPVDLDLGTTSATGAKGLAIDAHLEGLPPFIGIEMDDDYSLDARTSREGERASASIGLIEARFGTRGAFPAGPCTSVSARVCLDLDNTTTPAAAAADVRLEGIRSFAFRNETQPGDARKTQFLDFNTTQRADLTLSVVSRDHDDDFVDVHGTIEPLPEHVDLTLGERIVFHSSHVFDVRVAADIGKKAILDALEAPKSFAQGISVTTQPGERNATRAIAAITGVGTYLEVAPEDKSFRMDDWQPYTGAPGPSQDLLFHVHGFPDPQAPVEERDEILVELTVRDPAPGQQPQDLRGSFVSRDLTLAEILGVPPTVEELEAKAGKLTNVSLILDRAIDPAGAAPAVEAAITVGNAFAKFHVSNVPEEVYFEMRTQEEVASTPVHPGLAKETFVDIAAEAQIDAAHLEVDLRPDPNLLTIFDLQQVPTGVNLHIANNTAGPLIFLDVSDKTLDLQGLVEVWDDGHAFPEDPSLHLRLSGVNLGSITTTIVPGDLERDIEQVSQCEYVEKEPPKPAKEAYVLTSTPKSDQLYVEVNANATKVIDAELRWCPIDGRLLAIKFFAGFLLDIDIRIEQLSLLLNDMETVRLKPGFIMEVEGKFSKAVVDWGESHVTAETDIGAGIDVCFPVVGFCAPALGMPGIPQLPTIPIRPHFWVSEVHLDNLAVPTAAVTPCLPVPWPPFGARLGINVVLPLELEPHPHGTVPTSLPELIPADPNADTLWVLLVDPAPGGTGLYPWWAADLFFLIYVLATTDAGGIGFEFEFPIDPFVENCSLL